MKRQTSLGLEDPRVMREEAQKWAELYSAIGPQAMSFNALVLPKYHVGYDRLVVVPYCMSMIAILQVLSIDLKWQCADGVTQEELMHVHSTRYDMHIGRQTYAVLTKDSVRPDMMEIGVEEYPETTAVMGLQEFLLLCWAYEMQTDRQFSDARASTICADSRYADGTIPTVGYGGKTLFIGRIKESDKGKSYGIRTVVT